MRVCLINPRFPKSQFLVMNQGLLQLAAEVKRAGHSCEILDFTDRAQAFSPDRLKRFDLVGISAMTAQLWHAVEIAEALSPHVKVAWGGVHCLLDPLSILNRFPDHYVVSGEGEIPFVNLLEHLEGRRTIEWLSRQKGVCFSLEGRPHPAEPYFITDLEALADVNYHDYPNIARYIALDFHCFQQVIPTLIAVTARGCNWNCSFCINTICKKYGALHRSKSIGKIRRETEAIIDEFGVRILLPRDEDFLSNRKLVAEWMEYTTEKGLLWAASGRYNYFRTAYTPHLLAKMKESGLIQLGLSIESGCERLRNEVLRKQVTDEDIHNTIRTIRATVGDTVIVNSGVMQDFPGETAKDKIRTIIWMDRLSRNLNAQFSGPQPYRNYPYTELSERDVTIPRGSLEFYLKNVAPDGAILTAGKRSWSSLFYEFPLSLYFNSRTRLFRARDVAARPIQYDVLPPKYPSGYGILGPLFWTIRLRLRFGFWGLFMEPPAIYVLFLLWKKARILYFDTRGKFQRLPGRIRRLVSARAGVRGKGGEK